MLLNKTTIMDIRKPENIKEQIEQRLTDQQKSKEFKDIGRVANLRKEKSAYKLISIENLDNLELDKVQAFNMVKKDSVYPPIDVLEQKAKGVTAGCAFLKVKLREALPTKPKDDETYRKTYVTFITLFQRDLEQCLTVKDIADLQSKYRSFKIEEVLTYLFEADFNNLSEDKKSELNDKVKTNFRSASFYGADWLFKKIIEQVFGAKFMNMLYNYSDSARVNWQEAYAKEPLSQEQANAIKENIIQRKAKWIESNTNTLNEYKNMPDSQVLNKIKTAFKLSPHTIQLLKTDASAPKKWAIDYCERQIKRLSETLDKEIESVKPRDNDWSWFEKPKTREGKKDFIKERAINTKDPLHYIKRTGGYAIPIITPLELVDKFGFRAVNYGVALNDIWSKQHSVHFFGAISDLAELLNFDLKKVNQLGGLDIVFAGKGTKGHAATYFAQTKDINLTKGNGDGSVAHEYAHYFDNMIVELATKSSSPVLATEDVSQVIDYKLQSKIREFLNFIDNGKKGVTPDYTCTFYAQKRDTPPSYYSRLKNNSFTIEIKDTIEETIAEYSDLLLQFQDDETLYSVQQRCMGYIIDKFELESYEVPLNLKTSLFKQTSGYKRFKYSFFNPNLNRYTKSIDKRTPYWTWKFELFARAWETIVLKKLTDKGRQSNYLVDGIELLDNSYSNENCTYQYPIGSELDYLETLFDEIIVEFKRAFNVGDFTPYTTKREDTYVEFKGATGLVENKMEVSKDVVEFVKEEEDCEVGSIEINKSKVVNNKQVISESKVVLAFDSAFGLKEYLDNLKGEKSLNNANSNINGKLSFKIPLWHKNNKGDKLYFEYVDNDNCPYKFFTIVQETIEINQNNEVQEAIDLLSDLLEDADKETEIEINQAIELLKDLL